MYESRHDELGWYEWNGVIYVRNDIARSHHGVSAVVNHELTHNRVARSTPYGLVQTAISIARLSSPDFDADNKAADELHRHLMDASSWAHEAVASYAGVCQLASTMRDEETGKLPSAYQDGTEFISSLLDARTLSQAMCFHLAQVLALRAFEP